MVAASTPAGYRLVYPVPAVKVFLIGAGQVGSTIVEALHGGHDLTVIDLDAARLKPLAYRYDIATIEANGASRRSLADAGVADANLVIACTSRDEANLVAATFARIEAPNATTVIRTSNTEYIELWREGRLDVDFVVSSEVETANAITRVIRVPAAVQTDVFADGQIQMVEYVVSSLARPDLLGKPLRECGLVPRDSRLVSIIRDGTMIIPRGDAVIAAGDRLVVIGSPTSAQAWGELLSPGESEIDDVVIFGGGQVGLAVARALLEKNVGVRLIEPNRDRARRVAEDLPDARVYQANGLDPDFFERERIGKAQAAIFAMREDAKNHYAATLARVNGIRFTIAIIHDAIAREVYEHSGVDVIVNPRQVTAEEIVRFAHDPRTQQISMIENDRFEVLDITTSPTSEYVGLTFREMPIRGAVIGAVVREGKAVFPHSDDVLLAGDRVIVFTESARVADVERVL
ncbi:MAG: Trk system potassium transporter TrkA [Thermoleophilia bacterium]|nr:Trk system potassium transporter TrkA [Thermoleophilia bacterium]